MKVSTLPGAYKAYKCLPLAPTKVFGLLRGHPESCRGTRSLQLLGVSVCYRGFCKLLGLGVARFLRLNRAMKSGSQSAPLDGRYIPRGPGKQNHKRSLVYQFLHDLYNTAGESLPDAGHTSSNKRPRHGVLRFDKKLDKTKLRHLPPGTFADYHRLCVAEHPLTKISRTLFLSVRVLGIKLTSVHVSITFTQHYPGLIYMRLPATQVWMRDFGSTLRIRARSHHARCAICTRHQLIIKKLPQGPARNAQVGEYTRHLRRQYRDRQVYWSHRSESRSQASSGTPITELSLIVDGMDQAKHAYPKSCSISGSKEFANWSRPRLAATTIIAHGHAVLVGLSPDHVSTSGSRTMELVAHLMTKTLSYIDWRHCFVRLEADNCSKELKHQTAIRMMATQIALHNLKGCEFNYLSSGHSHEDIDAYFAVASTWLNRFPELHSVDDFRKCLSNMLANKSVRTNEPRREVVVYDQFRDWTPSCQNVFKRSTHMHTI